MLLSSSVQLLHAICAMRWHLEYRAAVKIASCGRHMQIATARVREVKRSKIHDRKVRPEPLPAGPIDCIVVLYVVRVYPDSLQSMETLNHIEKTHPRRYWNGMWER